MRSLVLFIASGGYLGYMPFAPGTWGTLVGIPLYFILYQLQLASPPACLLLFAVLVLGACWVAGQADVYLDEHDSHKIVIDEIVGYLAAMLFLEPTFGAMFAAFFIFRVFDVVKPFPAGYIDQHLPGGYGVTLDDVVSGFYTNLVVRVLILIGVPHLS